MPLTWSVVWGSLPSGMSMSSSGQITGTPPDSYLPATFIVRVTDGTVSATQAVTLSIPGIANPGPYGAAVDVIYSFQMNQVGMTAPLTWSIIAGILPLGLTFSTDGVISGTPTVAETVTLSFRIVDDTGLIRDRTYQIAVIPEGLYPTVINTWDFDTWFVSFRYGTNKWTMSGAILENAISGIQGLECSAGANTEALAKNWGLLAKHSLGVYFLGQGLPRPPTLVGYYTMGGYWNVSQGAWLYKGAYYALLRGSEWTMVRTGDGGASWAELDAGSGPTYGSFPALAWDSAYDQKFVHIISSTNLGFSYSLWSFNLDTGKWSAPYAEIELKPGGGTALFFSGAVVPLPSGGVGLFYVYSTGGTNYNVCYRRYKDGAWGSEKVLGTLTQDPGAGRSFNSILDPVREQIYYIWPQTGDGRGPLIFRKYTFDGDLVPSSQFIFPAVSNTDGVGKSVVMSDGNIYVAYDDLNDPSNAIWVSPISASPPSFVKELLPIGEGQKDKEPSCAYLLYGLIGNPAPTKGPSNRCLIGKWMNDKAGGNRIYIGKEDSASPQPPRPATGRIRKPWHKHPPLLPPLLPPPTPQPRLAA